MTKQTRLIVPGLFEAPMLQTLVGDAKHLHNQLITELKKSDQNDEQKSDLYYDLFGLSSLQRQYVSWLVPSELVTEQVMFRADPVILQPTHNGILCRGNDILHLDPDEQKDIETTFNEYFSERGLALKFYSPAEAVVYLPSGDDLADVAFSSLAEVLGQDLTHHLPQGNHGNEWQTILMETQMLLHRTETNQQRAETGEKTVGSLWFWGTNDLSDGNVKMDAAHIFTDSTLLHNAFLNKQHRQNIAQLTSLDQALDCTGTVDVVIEQLELASLQNDPQRWQNAFESVCNDWLVPAIEAVNNKSITHLEIVTETAHYTLKPWHKLRFWR